ncbi:hypothetical protein HII13_004639 [Brettanomyces bruxellensis]|uniref:DEBR0S6_08944g1_1 n=1 Tax=Dekkera bruxellensis TaxID=5007 RepID=A0A7D9H755_DEKBR|nr:hypothetical protein HII13_004639 [Brettanomyces bruxellensis]VUG20145.1 DEBR0S6_08944g1_1 [Brettanomyces bruxellensis]
MSSSDSSEISRSVEPKPVEEDDGGDDGEQRRDGEDGQGAARSMSRSSYSSLARTITEDIQNELRTVPSVQEEEVENEVGPFDPEFWKPTNIMSVEDTPFSRRYLVTLDVLFGAVLGNMARFGMTELTSYKNEYTHFYPGTCLWSNFTACFVMAWCNHAAVFWRTVLTGSGKTNMKQMALHSAVTAGFCGAYSTWSSFMVELIFKTIDYLNGGHKLPNHGYGVMEFFSVLFVQMGVSFLGYFLGRDFAYLIDLCFKEGSRSRIFNYRVCRILELLFAVLGIAAIIANIVLACTLSIDSSWKTSYALSIVIGVVGSWVRFRLSAYNGSFGISWFPSGTLMANVFACLLLPVLYILLYGYKDAATGTMIVTSKVHRMAITAFSSGFCGSLSTMSSFVNELYNLEYPLQRYTYFGVTFLSCFIIMFVIICPYAWTRGFIES